MNIFFKIKATFIFVFIATFAFSQDWTERLKITANVRANDAYFGASVAISGNFAIIGANQEKKDADNSEENSLTNAGAAYIFKNENGEWIFYQKIVASDRSAGDYFGHSVAIDGN
ncbi:MAG TPA: FG-GAP repeat protein, partial [Bacteroidales bacterium]|nr:FG-GAP repeat protein [Bacteroidales bacterium]